MSAPVRVALVGAGAWGRNHLRTLHALGALEGVVEASSVAGAQVLAEFPELRVWPNLDEAFEETRDLAGVVIATPAPTHADLVKVALRRGAGVLVEKPMALSAQEARALVDQADELNQVLMVGHLPLYLEAHAELRRLLANGILGRVHRLDLERTSLGRVRNTESVLWSFAPHDVALAVNLAGAPPLAVRAMGAAFLQTGIHDDVHLDLDFGEGLSAHVHVAWYWPSRRRSLRVLGETGMLVLDEAQGTLVLHRKRVRGGAPPGGLEAMDGGSSLLFQGGGEPLRAETLHFLHCLATGQTPLSDGRSGLEVTAVLERAHAQLQSHLSKENP